MRNEPISMMHNDILILYQSKIDFSIDAKSFIM